MCRTDQTNHTRGFILALQSFWRTTTLALLGSLFLTSQASAQVCTLCPSDAQASAIGSAFSIFVHRNGQDINVSGLPVGACETLTLVTSVAYQAQAVNAQGQIVVGAGFSGGTGIITFPSGSTQNVTPADMNTTVVGPAPCGTTTIKPMTVVNYTLTAQDIAAGSALFVFNFSGGVSTLPNAQGQCILPVSASPAQSVSIVALPSCSVAPANQAVCAGGSATFTASSTGPAAGGPFTFSWTGPAGFTATGPTITINNAQAANGGTYTATITDQFGCTSTCTATLVVNPNPTCTIAPATQAVCAGASATFTATVSSGTAPFTISWTGPNGFTATGPTITINNAQAANAGTYTANIVDANGCTGRCTAELIVNPNPTCTIAPASQAVCMCSTASFTDTVSS